MTFIELHRALRRKYIQSLYADDLLEFAVDLVTSELETLIRRNYEYFFVDPCRFEWFVEYALDRAASSAYDRDTTGYFGLFFEEIEKLTGKNLTLDNPEFQETLKSFGDLSDYYWNDGVLSQMMERFFKDPAAFEILKESADPIIREIKLQKGY